MEESSGGGDNRVQRPRVSSHKGKSCKGCLYYSSVLKSSSRSPVCVGISRTLPQVQSYIVGESEMEATNDGRNLLDFKYACVGYSVFLDNKDNQSDKEENQAELPFCAGLELLVDRRVSNASHTSAHAHRKEDGSVRSHPRPHKPAQHTGEEFFSRKVLIFTVKLMSSFGMLKVHEERWARGVWCGSESEPGWQLYQRHF
ncbi:hypothetical protein AXF42_Ash017840 [Apostasia shenzhenica]|uniref:DUF8204 domain-containing protein n=1 Tax=Apostasia shenzhenica TaxID=1088818 RepID=A0A2I0A3Y4_9ASPA|nr:hypothetical protein AXF42_Ash017840 [Apostasia shenzhenica]